MISYIIALKRGNISTYLGWTGKGFGFLTDGKRFKTEEEANKEMSEIDSSRYDNELGLVRIDEDE